MLGKKSTTFLSNVFHANILKSGKAKGDDVGGDIEVDGVPNNKSKPQASAIRRFQRSWSTLQAQATSKEETASIYKIPRFFITKKILTNIKGERLKIW